MSSDRPGTVLFADVSGSTRLYETAGDAAALEAISRCLEAARVATEAAGGRVVKTMGDEVMAHLPGSGRGRDAAAEMQAKIDSAAGDRRHQARRAHRLSPRPGAAARRRYLRRHGEPRRAPGSAGEKGRDHPLDRHRGAARRDLSAPWCASCMRSRSRARPKRSASPSWSGSAMPTPRCSPPCATAGACRAALSG